MGDWTGDQLGGRPSAVVDASRFLSRATEATRSSKRVALRDSLDYVELVRDVAAMANSGGGVIVLDGVAAVDEELLHEQLERYAEPEFESFTVEPITRDGRPSAAVVVEGARNAPLVSRTGSRNANPLSQFIHRLNTRRCTGQPSIFPPLQ